MLREEIKIKSSRDLQTKQNNLATFCETPLENNICNISQKFLLWTSIIRENVSFLAFITQSIQWYWNTILIIVHNCWINSKHCKSAEQHAKTRKKKTPICIKNMKTEKYISLD